MQVQTENPRVQWMIYDEVSRITDTLLYGLERRVSVGPTTMERPSGDQLVGYDVHVSWIDGDRRFGVFHTLLMLDLESRYEMPRAVIEDWALKHFGTEIGLWRAQRDGAA